MLFEWLFGCHAWIVLYDVEHCFEQKQGNGCTEFCECFLSCTCKLGWWSCNQVNSALCGSGACSNQVVFFRTCSHCTIQYVLLKLQNFFKKHVQWCSSWSMQNTRYRNASIFIQVFAWDTKFLFVCLSKMFELFR